MVNKVASIFDTCEAIERNIASSVHMPIAQDEPENAHINDAAEAIRGHLDDRGCICTRTCPPQGTDEPGWPSMSGG